MAFIEERFLFDMLSGFLLELLDETRVGVVILPLALIELSLELCDYPFLLTNLVVLLVCALLVCRLLCAFLSRLLDGLHMAFRLTL